MESPVAAATIGLGLGAKGSPNRGLERSGSTLP